MRKVKTQFVCQGCGGVQPRWLGRCPECGEWNTLQEEFVSDSGPASPRTSGGVPGSGAVSITASALTAVTRTRTGVPELDRVLGGGMVSGSVVLIGGDPGIGKSTLVMQASRELARAGCTVLYVTGEESTQQVRLRAERLDAVEARILLLAATDLESIEAAVREIKPGCLILDSVQTLTDSRLESAAGTVSQVRAAALRMGELAKSGGPAVFLIGHVTKEGTIAGPRVLEHMVDTVLYFEGERHGSYRILRAVKNRFGSTDEIGLFLMGDDGLREVSNPSEAFLAERAVAEPGSAVIPLVEGSRPLLVEVQALVTRSYLASPRRTASGLDHNRLAMLLAVLEKRCGLRFGDRDVFVNVVGGLRIAEPAADLGVALALASSHRGHPIQPSLVSVGEVGLAGEIRRVGRLDLRLREAARMGFTRAVASGGAAVIDGMQVHACTNLREAMGSALLKDAVVDQTLPEDPFADG